MDSESALDLLRQNHAFPGSYEFRIVVLPDAVATVVSTIEGAGATIEDVRERPSRTGKYISLRVRALVQQAEDVLHVYSVLGSSSGVVTAL